MCNLTAIGFILYSQSVGRSTCACRLERCKLSRQGLTFVLLQSLGLFLMSCEKCLFLCGALVVEVLAAVEGSGRGGGGWRTAVSHQCSSRAVSQSWPRRATGRNSKKWKYLQLEGRPNLFPHILVLISASGRRDQRNVQIPGQKWKSRHHLGVIMPFPHGFPSFHLSGALPLSSLHVGSALLACSGSGPPPPPHPLTPPVIQDWLFLRALLHTLNALFTSP